MPEFYITKNLGWQFHEVDKLKRQVSILDYWRFIDNAEALCSLFLKRVYFGKKKDT